MLSSLATIAVEKEMDFKKELRGRDSIVLSVSTSLKCEHHASRITQ
jgi:hypothetical protein